MKIVNPIRVSAAETIAAKYGHDRPVVVARSVGERNGGGEQRTAYGAAKTIALFDQTAVRQDTPRAKSDERDVSTTIKCIICLVIGLIVGVCAVEAKSAQVTGQVGLRDVMRCISAGP